MSERVTVKREKIEVPTTVSIEGYAGSQKVELVRIFDNGDDFSLMVKTNDELKVAYIDPDDLLEALEELELL